MAGVLSPMSARMSTSHSLSFIPNPPGRMKYGGILPGGFAVTLLPDSMDGSDAEPESGQGASDAHAG